MEIESKYDKVECKLCRKKFFRITNTHLWKVHNITMDEYMNMFPNEPLEDPKLAKDRVEHLRFKSYEEVYGKEKATKLKRKRSEDAIEQMKNNNQIQLRRDAASKMIHTKEQNLDNSLVRTINGKSNYHKRAVEHYGDECMRCGNNENIVVHHIDMNQENNDISNLLVLCRKCHAKYHNEMNKGRFTGQPLIEKGMIYMLRGLKEEFGLDLKDVNFTDTPKRVARAWCEIFSGINAKDELKAILNTKFPTEYDGMVLEGPIRCYSMCPHHFLPVIYDVYVAYIPTNGGLGLSKIPRLVELLGKAPKLQEDFTHEIVNTIQTSINPKGVMALVFGEHLCMQMRGIKKPGCTTKTSSFTGVFEQKDTRDEFLQLVKMNGDLK